MTNSKIFIAAWNTARAAAARFGGSARSFFTEALRMTYAAARRAAKLADLHASLNVAAMRAYKFGATPAQIGLIVHLADVNNEFSIISSGTLTKREASSIIDEMKAAA